MVEITPKILLVEDNEDDYEATARGLQLHRSQNKLHWFKSCQEALSYLKTSDKSREALDFPDLILLDLNLPGMDGKKFLRLLKEDEDLKTIPVIILTTSNDQKDIHACYEYGANGYIQKPVSYDRLRNIMQKFKEYWFGLSLLPGNESHE